MSNLKYMSAFLACVVALMSCSGSADPDSDDNGNDSGILLPDKNVPYVKKSLFMDFTSTGCQNCPEMATHLETVAKERPDEFYAVAMHSHFTMIGDEMAHPMTETYMKSFNILGMPAGLLDLRPGKHGAPIRAIKEDIEYALDEAKKIPANCGIALETSFDEATRDVSVTVKVTSNKHRPYRYIIILTEDGIKGTQAGVDGQYIHNHVARELISKNVFGDRVNAAQPLEPGKEYTVTRNVKALNPSYRTESMNVIASVLYSEDNGLTWACDNSISCPLGKSADYLIGK